MCLKFSILGANFAASIFEDVSVELCGAGVVDVTVWELVLLLEVFDIVGWYDAGVGEGGVVIFEDGNVVVCSGVNF